LFDYNKKLISIPLKLLVINCMLFTRHHNTYNMQVLKSFSKQIKYLLTAQNALPEMDFISSLYVYYTQYLHLYFYYWDLKLSFKCVNPPFVLQYYWFVTKIHHSFSTTIGQILVETNAIWLRFKLQYRHR